MVLYQQGKLPGVDRALRCLTGVVKDVEEGLRQVQRPVEGVKLHRQAEGQSQFDRCTYQIILGRGIGVSGVWRSLIDKRVRETQATRYPDRQMLRPHGRREKQA